MAGGLVLWAGLLVGDPATSRAQDLQDDLSVVKRAVAQAAATPAPTPPALQEDRPAPRTSGSKPQWLRVRVTERGGKRVRINLPLTLVRAVGDWPIDFGCGSWERRRCKLRVSEVLDALDAGQSLVEVDDDDGTTVRVWIE
jgi:hypothetical protein